MPEPLPGAFLPPWCLLKLTLRAWPSWSPSTTLWDLENIRKSPATFPLFTAPQTTNPSASVPGFRQSSGQLTAVTTVGQADLPCECPSQPACTPGPQWPSFPMLPVHRDSLQVLPQKSPRHSLPSGNTRMAKHGCHCGDQSPQSWSLETSLCLLPAIPPRVIHSFGL